MRFATTRRAAVAALAAALPLALASTAPAQDASTADQTIEVMQKLFGQHPGNRVNHAKGVVVEGGFTPSEAGARLSRAAMFRSGTVPVVARFSDATGVPNIPDNSAQARPNGIAVRFDGPGSDQMDMVLNTLPFFPVATGEEFLEMLRAASESGPDAPKPTAMDRFRERHPSATRPGLNVGTPASLARVRYNGINAFVLVDSSGKRQPFRVRLVPVEGEQTLGADEAAKRGPNFLMDEIKERLAQRPAQFRFVAQLAKPGDQTKDGSQPWPDDRELVELGTVTLTRVSPDGDKIAREVVFMPNNLPDGIEVSDDPLIDSRVAAYAVSYGFRSR